ncbi:MAG: hypothetical protein ABW360_11615 [Phenylobacterium sp.]
MTARVRVFLMAAVLLLAAPLSACGIGKEGQGLFCSTPCKDSKQIRDGFCGCADRAPPPAPHPPSSGGGPLVANCMCNLGEGKYSAWFTGSFVDYKSLPGKTVTISATSCSVLNYCPRRVTGNGETFDTAYGAYRLKIGATGESVFFGENTFWATGALVEQDHSEEMRAARAVARASGSLVQLAAAGDLKALKIQLSTSPLDCRRECAEGGSCTELQPGQQLAQSLGGLRTVVGGKTSGEISQSTLLSLFGQTGDPCRRGDTVIAGGRMSNPGSGCVLRTPINVGANAVQLRIDVPPLLAGGWRSRADGVDIAFDNPTAAPTLSFEGANAQAVESLNALFGGRMTTAGVDGQSARLGTVKGCVLAGL